MAGFNKTSFTFESYFDLSMPPDVAIMKCLEILNTAVNDESVLCINDACRLNKISEFAFNHYSKILPSCNSIKKEVRKTISSRINSKILDSTFNATAGIFRMKVLGDREELIDTDTQGSIKIFDDIN